MKLNNDNYYSVESNKAYMSASQFKDFLKCEKMAMAKINGEYQQPNTTPLLVGGYVDAYFSGEMEQYRFNHPELFNKDGSLKSYYKQADTIIERIKRDEYMMHLLSGSNQTIETGVIEGVPFKIKMDSLLPDCIVDQKIMKDTKDVWNNELRQYEPFWKAYGYDIQLAIYQYIHAQNEGVMLPCKLAVATKEDACDLKVYRFSQKTLNEALDMVKALAPSFQEIKDGKAEPTECGECAVCRDSKILSESDEVEI